MRYLFPTSTAAAALALAAAHGAPAAPARPAEEHVVRMEGTAYAPAELRVAVGDTIRFVNDDAVDHNVFVPTAAYGVDLGKQEPGQEAILPVGAAGGFEVECVFHPGMLLKVDASR